MSDEQEDDDILKNEWLSDDDVPWASPEIQQNYEAALGRFMLAFNRLDNILGEILSTVLTRLGRDDIINDCVYRDFSSTPLDHGGICLAQCPVAHQLSRRSVDGSNNAAIWASVSCCRRISCVSPDVKDRQTSRSGPGSR